MALTLATSDKSVNKHLKIVYLKQWENIKYCWRLFIGGNKTHSHMCYFVQVFVFDLPSSIAEFVHQVKENSVNNSIITCDWYIQWLSM